MLVYLYAMYAMLCVMMGCYRWLAWHDEQKYLQKANQALEIVLSAIVECGFPVRVFAYKVLYVMCCVGMFGFLFVSLLVFLFVSFVCLLVS